MIVALELMHPVIWGHRLHETEWRGFGEPVPVYLARRLNKCVPGAEYRLKALSYYAYESGSSGVCVRTIDKLYRFDPDKLTNVVADIIKEVIDEG